MELARIELATYSMRTSRGIGKTVSWVPNVQGSDVPAWAVPVEMLWLCGIPAGSCLPALRVLPQRGLENARAGVAVATSARTR